MNRIRIGADELILWLRKNSKAVNSPNDGAQGLGRRLYELIISMGGVKVSDNEDAYWSSKLGDKNISQYGLPKSSAQYEIDTNQLPALFNELIQW